MFAATYDELLGPHAIVWHFLGNCFMVSAFQFLVDIEAAHIWSAAQKKKTPEKRKKKKNKNRISCNIIRQIQRNFLRNISRFLFLLLIHALVITYTNTLTLTRVHTRTRRLFHPSYIMSRSPPFLVL